MKLVSDLSSLVSQEIPGYPQAFQESWKFSNRLTQTHRGRVLTGPDGPRRHGSIYSVGPLCVLGVQEGIPSAVWGPFSGVQQLSLGENYVLLDALPSFQDVHKVFSVAVSKYSAGSKSQQESQSSSGLNSCVFLDPRLNAYLGRTVSGGEESKG